MHRESKRTKNCFTFSSFYIYQMQGYFYGKIYTHKCSMVSVCTVPVCITSASKNEKGRKINYFTTFFIVTHTLNTSMIQTIYGKMYTHKCSTESDCTADTHIIDALRKVMHIMHIDDVNMIQTLYWTKYASTSVQRSQIALMMQR